MIPLDTQCLLSSPYQEGSCLVGCSSVVCFLFVWFIFGCFAGCLLVVCWFACCLLAFCLSVRFLFVCVLVESLLSCFVVRLLFGSVFVVWLCGCLVVSRGPPGMRSRVAFTNWSRSRMSGIDKKWQLPLMNHTSRVFCCCCQKNMGKLNFVLSSAVTPSKIKK